MKDGFLNRAGSKHHVARRAGQADRGQSSALFP